MTILIDSSGLEATLRVNSAIVRTELVLKEVVDLLKESNDLSRILVLHGEHASDEKFKLNSLEVRNIS